MQGSELEALIRSGIPDAEITVKGEGDHFEVVVVSARFDGCTMVQQHRMVYAALGGRMGGEIHALALHTYTPDEWAARPRIQ
ncbi:MAG: BolA/IbaG family iron-sulfur metabolism protein [Gammaproteobacteria bacterium]|jgi:acid stress-induced BolA-like protein IbaG/YrbA